MPVITIAADVRLDLGHTDLVGTLVFDGDGLVLVTPSGNEQLLGSHLFGASPGEIHQAPLGCVLIEEMGLFRRLPEALVTGGYCQETARHRGISAWGADVIELCVNITDSADSSRTLVSSSTESE